MIRHLTSFARFVTSNPAIVWMRGQKALMRALGILVLVGGVTWSVNSLDLKPEALTLRPFLLNLLIAAPLNLLVAAYTLQLSAQVLDRDLPNRGAVGAVARANVAELLPLPGGALVRGAALMSVGAGLAESARIVTITAILTLCMTVAFSAMALVMLGRPLGWIVVGAGLIGAVGVLTVIGRQAGVVLTAKLFAIRLVTIAVGLTTLFLSFQALGAQISLTEVALFVVSTTLGSSVSIVPAGLGVNEAIAAGLAAMVTAPPAAAFLAVALNRAIGLLAGAAIAAGFSFWRKT